MQPYRLLRFITNPFLFFTYGLYIILGFAATIIVLDLASFSWPNNRITLTLAIDNSDFHLLGI